MLHISIQQKDKSEKDYSLQYHETAIQCLSEDQSRANIDSHVRFYLLKRISPFLIAEVCLPLLFMYWMIRSMHHTLLFLLLFLFVEITAITIDFALWNYHEGKKIWKIWMIEIVAIVFALYFII